MTKIAENEIEKIVELLRTGEQIPSEYESLLFPPMKQEYELVYGAKARVEDVLSETMAVPLQAIRSFNNGQDWSNMLIFGDNLQTMKTLLRMKREGSLVNNDGTEGVKLIYIDPPFATKQEFRGGEDERAYQDKVAGAQFLEFIRKRLIFMRELLSPTGSIYIHLDWRKGHHLKVLADELFGEARFTNEIIWQRTSARSDSKSYNHIHDTIFMYTKGSNFTFNTQYTDYDQSYIDKFYRHRDEDGRRYSLGDLTARGTRNGDTGKPWKGIDPNEKGNHWKVTRSKLDELDDLGLIYWPERGSVPRLKQYLDERKGVPLQSIWSDISPVQYAAKENYGYPTQKPEELLRRIIASSSDEGDIVFDAFAGSGTTLAVAEKLGRRWIGIDCGKLAIYTIQKRMFDLHEEIGNKGDSIEPGGFTLMNAGLYDFSQLKRLSWDDWRFFALNLFNCTDDPHTVGGIDLDGYRGADDVLVFNHLQDGGVVLDYGFVDDLHEQIGDRVSKQMFIIAPAASVTFLEDYLDRGETRYYLLRIPYSIINELHSRDFEAITQPVSEEEVNATVEAVGFDFMRLPDVKCEYFLGASDGQFIDDAIVKIKKFESKALVKGISEKENLETLSMVMIDFSYDGKTFNPDRVFFAQELREADWEVRLPVGSLGDEIMIAYLDVYGNEYKEVKGLSDFEPHSGERAA